MQIRVLYFGLMRQYVSEGEEEFDMPDGSTVGDLFNLLEEKHGQPLYERLIEEHRDGSREIVPNAFVTLDGYNITGLEGLDTVLKPDTDTHIVLVGPVVTGG